MDKLNYVKFIPSDYTVVTNEIMSETEEDIWFNRERDRMWDKRGCVRVTSYGAYSRREVKYSLVVKGWKTDVTDDEVDLAIKKTLENISCHEKGLYN